MCEDKERPKVWINLLNPGSMEELGKAVYEALMNSDAKCEYVDGLKHRHIEVTGS